MTKLFSSILFSFFLFFHTAAIAEEEITPSETDIEVQEVQESEYTEENNTQEVTKEVQEEVEPVEVLSEAEKEALAAEEAELRELGMDKEPVPE